MNVTKAIVCWCYGLNVVFSLEVHVLEAWPQYGGVEVVEPLRGGGLVKDNLVMKTPPSRKD